MNYMPIHTNVHPSYNFLAAENAYLKQEIEYKNAVLCDQQDRINKLGHENTALKLERDASCEDAERWRIMKQIIKTQGSEQALYVVEKTVAKDLDKRRKESMERCDRCSCGTSSHPPAEQNR